VVDPWYLSTIAYIGYSLIILFVVIYIVIKINRIKIKNLEHRKNELAKLVFQRTQDLLKEKEKTEELLKQSETAKTELKAANDLKSQLLSVAAHDLKNPLQAILGYEFIIREDFKMSDEEWAMVNSIFQSAKMMLSIITDILESAAASSAKLELKFEPMKMADLIRESIKNNKARLNQKNQKVIEELDEEAVASIDKIWFKEAIENLMSNAIKYSPMGKTIWIKVRKNEKTIRISVIDEGPGLTDNDKKKLFNKFQRLSARPTGGETSTGLGLYIVKDIVEKHNGKVYAESTPGQGSEFIIELPVS